MTSPALLSAALTAVDEASVAVQACYAQVGTAVDFKADGSPLTRADRESHRILMQRLSETGIAVISEESKKPSIPPSGTAWVIDPLDGTKDFIARTGEFCVMAGLLSGGRPVLGVVKEPSSGRTYFAQDCRGAFLRQDRKDVRLHVSDRASWQGATAIVSRHHFSSADEKLARALPGIRLQPMGSIGSKWGAIASGHADAYWNLDGLNVWDVCAPQVILEQAGGRVTDGQGEPLRFSTIRFSGGILASNGVLHSRLVSAAGSLRK